MSIFKTYHLVATCFHTRCFQLLHITIFKTRWTLSALPLVIKNDAFPLFLYNTWLQWENMYSFTNPLHPLLLSFESHVNYMSIAIVARLQASKQRDCSIVKCVGLEPGFGVSRQDIRSSIRSWLVNQHWIWRQGLGETQRHAWELISRCCLGAKARFLSFNRTQSRAVTGLLTGHIPWEDIFT